MKITFVNIGSTQEEYLRKGIDIFGKRIEKYAPFSMICLNEPKNLRNLPENMQKEAEGRLIMPAIEKADRKILLDVTGRQMNSESFAKLLQQYMNMGTRNLAFIAGGPYGFSDEVYQKVGERISLSAMTFSHQMVRLIFMEQLYRAFTIIKGEPYHHA